MRLSVKDVSDFVSQGLSAYWRWMTGSLVRFVVGYAAPIAALVLAVNTVRGDSSMTADTAARGAIPASTSQVAGAAVANTTAGPQQAVVRATPTSTPTVARSVLTYVVKSGDSLGAICSAQVPSLEINACVTAIVALNKLSGPDQLSLGQSLSLPAAGGQSSPGSPTAAGASVSQTGQAATTSTPRPAATTSAPRLQDIKFDSLSSPIKAGQTATLRATVTPNANCSLQYAPPDGSQGITNSLVAKAADSSGAIAWTWEIDGKTKKGKGLVVVTCGGTSLSAYIEIS